MAAYSSFFNFLSYLQNRPGSARVSVAAWVVFSVGRRRVLQCLRHAAAAAAPARTRRSREFAGHAPPQALLQWSRGPWRPRAQAPALPRFPRRSRRAVWSGWRQAQLAWRPSWPCAGWWQRAGLCSRWSTGRACEQGFALVVGSVGFAPRALTRAPSSRAAGCAWACGRIAAPSCAAPANQGTRQRRPGRTSTPA